MKWEDGGCVDSDYTDGIMVVELTWCEEKSASEPTGMLLGPAEKAFRGQAQAYRAHFARPLQDPVDGARTTRSSTAAASGRYYEQSFVVGDIVQRRSNDEEEDVKAVVVRVVYQARVKGGGGSKGNPPPPPPPPVCVCV